MTLWKHRSDTKWRLALAKDMISKEHDLTVVLVRNCVAIVSIIGIDGENIHEIKRRLALAMGFPSKANKLAVGLDCNAVSTMRSLEEHVSGFFGVVVVFSIYTSCT